MAGGCSGKKYVYIGSYIYIYTGGYSTQYNIKTKESFFIRELCFESFYYIDPSF